MHMRQINKRQSNKNFSIICMTWERPRKTQQVMKMGQKPHLEQPKAKRLLGVWFRTSKEDGNSQEMKMQIFGNKCSVCWALQDNAFPDWTLSL